MAEEALHADPKFLSVSFSPWRFEDYEDVKTALMAAVIGALRPRSPLGGRALRLPRGGGPEGTVASVRL
jgi:hypothetical protein